MTEGARKKLWKSDAEVAAQTNNESSSLPISFFLIVYFYY